MPFTKLENNKWKITKKYSYVFMKIFTKVKTFKKLQSGLIIWEFASIDNSFLTIYKFATLNEI